MSDSGRDGGGGYGASEMALNEPLPLLHVKLDEENRSQERKILSLMS